MPTIQAIIGLPGVGKTQRLIQDLEEHLKWCPSIWPAVTSYTNFTCDGVTRRVGGEIESDTIYKLIYPHAKHYVPSSSFYRPSKKRYQKDTLRSEDTSAIKEFVDDAPTSRGTKAERSMVQRMRRELHSCSDEFPSWIHDEKIPRGLQHDVTLARWLDAGANLESNYQRLSSIYVDEAQDLSVLQARAVLALCRPDAQIRVYGDPFQAILTQGLEGESPPLFAWADETETLVGGHRVPLPIARMAQKVMEPWGCPPAEDWADLSRKGEILRFSDGARHRQGFRITHSRATAATLARDCPVKFLLDPKVCLRRNVDFRQTPLFGAPAMVKGWESPVVYLHKFAKRFMQQFDQGDFHVRKQVFVALTRAQYRVQLHDEWYRRLAI